MYDRNKESYITSGLYYRNIFDCHVMVMMNDTCTKKVSKCVASVVNYFHRCDATIWSVNLTTLELSFTIVICLYYRQGILKGEVSLYC